VRLLRKIHNRVYATRYLRRDTYCQWILDSGLSPSLIPTITGLRWARVAKVRCLTDISPADMSGPQGQIRRLTDVPAAYIWSAGIRARSPDLHFRTYATRCLRRDMYRQLVFDSRMCSTLHPTVFMLLGCTPLLQYWVNGFQYFATGLPTVLGYWARWARVASARSLTAYPPEICLVRWGACVSLRLYTRCGISG
jgi:hypothetical protein